MTARRGDLVAIAGPLLAVGIAGWITFPAWGPGPFAGVDVTAAVMRVTFGVEKVFGRGHLDGWFPDANLGYELFLLRGPGLAVLVAALRVATLGQLPIVAALTAVTLASFVLFPIAVVYLARSLGLGPRAAGLAALLALAVEDPFCNGIQGLFGLGQMENQVAAIWFCLALGGLARIAAGEGGWVAFTAAMLAALVITHVPSALVMAPLALLLLPWVATGPPRAVLVRLLATGALAAALAGFWLLPLLAHHDLVGSHVGRRGVPPLVERLHAIADGHRVFRPGVAWAVLVGWTWALVEAMRGRRRLVAFVAASLGYLVIGHAMHHRWPSELTEQIALRGVAYAGVLATFPLAALLATIGARFGRLFDALFVGATAALVALALSPLRVLVVPYPTPHRVLREAAAVLAREVPRGARFSTPQHLYTGEMVGNGLAGPDRWLAWQSGRGSLNGLTAESSSTPWVVPEAERLDTSDVEASADLLGRLGVTHVVSPSPELTGRLAKSPRFRLRWRASPLAVFALLPGDGQPPPSSLLGTKARGDGRLRHVEPEHLRLKTWAPAATEASVAVAWSPKWHLAVDGRPAPMRSTPNGLIALTLPAGRHWIALDFRRDAWDRLGVVVSLLTVLAVAVGRRLPSRSVAGGGGRLRGRRQLQEVDADL